MEEKWRWARESAYYMTSGGRREQKDPVVSGARRFFACQMQKCRVLYLGGRVSSVSVATGRWQHPILASFPSPLLQPLHQQAEQVQVGGDPAGF